MTLKKLMTDFYNQYGPWALITGASSGIGKAFSVHLAAQGFNLVLVARREEVLALLADELTRVHQISVKVISGDLTSLDFVLQIESLTHSLDIGLLINNAGFALTGGFLDHRLEEQLSLLHLNCRAPLMLSHIFGKRMCQKRRGGIIYVASASAFLPLPFWANYSASKVYGLYLTEALGFELKNKGVDVLALCPGATRTGFSIVAGTKTTGMEPAQVAHIGLKNLGKKSMVIAGLNNRIITFILRFFPRRWLCKIGAKAVLSQIDPSKRDFV